MKKFARLIALALSSALLLTACGKNPANTQNPVTSGSSQSGSGASENKTAKDMIVFSPRLDFATMDVQNTPSIVTKSIYYLVYNTLVEKDVETNAVIPALAESWTKNSATEIVFNLRQGVKFHDGSDFTAADVKFTYEKALESAGSAAKLASLQSIETDGDYIVKITLKSANMDFLDLLTDPSLSIMSKTAFESLGEEEGIQQGTGPYKYAEWNQGSYLDLEANEAYWGGAPATPKLRVQYISENSSRLIAVQTGELDFCQDPPQAELANIAANPELQLITYPSATVDFVAFNLNEAPMDNPDVRKAIAYAINRQDIIDGVFLGNATELNNIMHFSNAYYSEIEGTEYNVEKAKELLANAGYADGFELTLACNTTSDSQAACTIIQALLDEVGITVKLDVMENATLTATMSAGAGYHMCFSRWSGYAFGPDTGIREMLYTGGSNNYGHLSDPKMDQMIDEALAIEDEAKRIAAYKAIEEYSDEVMAVYPILVENYTFVARKSVENILQPNGPIMNFREILAYQG